MHMFALLLYIALNHGLPNGGKQPNGGNIRFLSAELTTISNQIFITLTVVGCTSKDVVSGEAHLHDLAPGQHSSVKISHC